MKACTYRFSPLQGSGASSSRSGLPGAPSVRTRSRVVRRMRLRTVVVLAPMKSICPEAESFDATRGVDSKLDAPVQHTQHAPMCSWDPPPRRLVPLKLAKDGDRCLPSSEEFSQCKLVCLLCVWWRRSEPRLPTLLPAVLRHGEPPIVDAVEHNPWRTQLTHLAAAFLCECSSLGSPSILNFS
jgi:hypothetical protein